MFAWPCFFAGHMEALRTVRGSRAELLKLIESLKRDGMKFKEAPFYRAGYDSPFKLTNRRNEVWLIKDEE